MNKSLQNPHLIRRVVASAIDFVLVPLVSFIVMLVTGVMESAEAYAGNQIWLRGIGLGVVGYLLVNGWLLHRRGQTVGKMCMGIMIIDAKTGEKPPWWRLVFIRALFFPLLYLPVLVASVGLWALLPLLDQAFIFRADRRCLHDLLAGTSVTMRTAPSTA
ncbi:MAG: RDD family protein [bacterium]